MSIFDFLGSKKSSTLDLLNVKRIHGNLLYTADNRKIGYVIVDPINMSVTSSLITSGRVDALKNVIISTGTVEIMAVNAFQNFESNRRYFDSLIKSEKNEKLQRLDELDQIYFDNLKERMATSREFLVAASFPAAESDESINTELGRIRMYLFENQFTARVADKEDIKRLLAVFCQGASFSLPDFDGEPYIETEESYSE